MIVIIQTENGKILGMLDMSGNVFDKPTTKVWNSSFSDFNYPEKEKLIKEIYLESKSDCNIEVIADNITKCFKVKGKQGIQTIKTYVKGKKISINFVCNNSGTTISNPQVLVGVL